MNDLDVLTHANQALMILVSYRKYKDSIVCPRTMSQPGLAEKMNISKGHVAIIIGRLLRDNLIKSQPAHVSNVKRKINVYIVTDKGVAMVQWLRGMLGALAPLYEGNGGVEDPELASTPYIKR